MEPSPSFPRSDETNRDVELMGVRIPSLIVWSGPEEVGDVTETESACSPGGSLLGTVEILREAGVVGDGAMGGRMRTQTGGDVMG